MAEKNTGTSTRSSSGTRSKGRSKVKAEAVERTETTGTETDVEATETNVEAGTSEATEATAEDTTEATEAETVETVETASTEDGTDTTSDEPAPEPEPEPVREHVVDTETIRRRIRKAHYNTVDSVGKLVSEYQRRQKYGDVTVTFFWDAETEAHYQWVLTLQQAMNQHPGKKVNEDGDYRQATDERVRNIQRRLVKDGYSGELDGVPGEKTCTMLGVDVHPSIRGDA